MSYEDAERLLSEWGHSHSDYALEIFVIGSMANQTKRAASSKKSDLDLVIFVSDSAPIDNFYQDIADVGLKTGVLIHALFIRESERNMKMSLPQYANAFEEHRRLV